MAHAYKKTLLAQLGFADADKQNPKHDLAVEYLALEHNAKRLIASLEPGFGWETIVSAQNTMGEDAAAPTHKYWEERKLSDLQVPVRERPLTKGEGQYRSTVGFLDLVLGYIAKARAITERTDESKRREEHSVELRDWPCRLVIVEVKAAPLPTGDLLRQMKLYREYRGNLNSGQFLPHHWVVAGCFKFSATQANALRAEGFVPVSLGPLFDEWAERQRTDRTLATDIEEF
jgi:hypothetical protein